MPTIVVTGALGHIGSRLIRDLPIFIPNTHFRLIDNLLTQRYASLFNLPNTATYTFTEDDITKVDLSSLIAGADVVIHLAAITTAADSFSTSEEVEHNNLHGTQRVAEACAQQGVPLFFPSTSSVYGPQGATVAEDCSPADINPQSPYAATKIKEEQVLAAQTDLQYMIARFGTICGVSPGMRFHTAVNRFCWQAVLGQPLTVWQTALHQKRPYLDLREAVAAISFFIQQSLFDREVYNVVTQNATVRDIIDVIQEHIPTVNVKLVEAAIMNNLSYDVVSDKIRAKGFTYQGNIAVSVADTIRLLRAGHE